MSSRASLPRGFWLLLVGLGLNRAGGFVLPFLALALSEREQLALAEVGLVLAAWGAGTLLAARFGGAFSARLGPKPTLMVSLSGGAVALSALAAVDGPAGHSLAALAFGALGALDRPAVTAALAQLLPHADRARAYGHLNRTSQLAFIASPLLAGWLLENHGWNWLFLGNAGAMLAAALVILRGVPQTRPRTGREHSESLGRSSAARDPRLTWMLVAALAIGLVIVQGIAALSIMARRAGLSYLELGQLFALNGALIALLQPMALPRMERAPPGRVLPWAALLFSLGFAAHAIAGDFRVHAACVCAWTLGQSALFPLCNARVAALTPASERSRDPSAYWMTWSIANILGSLAGLTLLEQAGPAFWAILPLAVAAIAPFALARASRAAIPAEGSESARAKT